VGLQSIPQNDFLMPKTPFLKLKFKKISQMNKKVQRKTTGVIQGGQKIQGLFQDVHG